MSAARASAAVIRNAIKAAKDCGVPIGAVEVLRDGSVRILATTPEAPLEQPPQGLAGVRQMECGCRFDRYRPFT